MAMKVSFVEQYIWIWQLSMKNMQCIRGNVTNLYENLSDSTTLWKVFFNRSVAIRGAEEGSQGAQDPLLAK